DRIKRTVQPTGAEERLSYDAESNVVGRSRWGRTGGPSPSGNNTSQNLELQRLTYTYDARNRLIQFDREDPLFPLTDGSLTLDDHKVTTVFNRDRLGRAIYTIDDDSSRTERLFDGATRNTKETDPVGNVVEGSFDDDDNLVKLVEKD